MGIDSRGFVFILDVIRFYGTPMKVLDTILRTAANDGKGCTIGIEQDPGQAGKVEAQMLVRELRGYHTVINPVHESKGTRAKPLSAQTEAGNVHVVRAPWNKAFYHEYENFDGEEKNADGTKKNADQVDAGSGAYQILATKSRAGVWGRSRN